MIMTFRNSLLSLKRAGFNNALSRNFVSNRAALFAPQKIQLKNLAINYEQVGNGPHAVVCLPGTLGFIESDFGPQIKKLNKDRFTVVVWDPPGYGKSRPPERDYSGNFFQKDAHVVAELMTSLGHERYSVLGWSGGGVTAIMLAADYPEKVRKLVTWGAHAFMDDNTLDNPQLGKVEFWTEQMKAPLVKVYGEEYLRMLWNGWVDACVGFNKGGGDMGHKTRLKDIKCPALIINGELDPVTKGPYHAEYLHKHIKDSRLFIWPKGKHNLHLRYPDEFNSLVEEFLVK